MPRTDLTKTELTKLRERLEEERKRILDLAAQTESEEKTYAERTPGDEADEASSEINRSINRRLRDREHMLLSKIDKAIARMDEGIYNECDSCEGPIGYKRLMARPVTTLCIQCKEEQERAERDIAS